MVALPETRTKTIVENYNLQRQRNEGTNLEDIIADAYHNKHFRSGAMWYFTTIMKDARFKDNVKYRRCLELLDVAATDEHKRELEKPDLDATALMDAANKVAVNAMKTLFELEDRPFGGNEKRGYAGVGARVTKIMTKKFHITDRAQLNNCTLAQAIASGKKTTRITDYNQLQKK